MQINEIKVIKSQKTQDRICAIELAIKAHQKNIKFLKSGKTRFANLIHGSFRTRIVKYSCIPYSEARFIWTVNNLTEQVNELQKELSTLIEFGA